MKHQLIKSEENKSKENKKPPEGGLNLPQTRFITAGLWQYGLMTAAINGFCHIFHNFLRITEDHHRFIVIEQVIV